MMISYVLFSIMLCIFVISLLGNVMSLVLLKILRRETPKSTSYFMYTHLTVSIYRLRSSLSPMECGAHRKTIGVDSAIFRPIVVNKLPSDRYKEPEFGNFLNFKISPK